MMDEPKTKNQFLEKIDELHRRIVELEAIEVKHRQTAQALRESEKRFKELWDEAPVAYHILDTQGMVISVNQTEEKMLGYTKKEMLGRSIFEFISPEQRAQAEERFQLKMLGQKVPKAEVRIYVRKDGAKIYVDIDDVLEKDSHGKIIGVRTTMVDITERKRAEKELSHTLEILRKSLWATTHAICMIVESRDPYTAGHQRRVADLARAIATEMGLAGNIIDGIRIAALLHDIGKISVPSEILSKPGKLNENELSLIKAHPKVAYDILSSIEFPWPIADIILQHHERMDGSGYPQGLSDDDILIEARILGVADVAAAMVSHRPYRSAHELEDVFNELSQKSGALFDSKVTEVCLRLFKEKNFSFRTESAR